MPRDTRPYLTYPIGYTLHPRLDMLTDAAFRAFHEMNDYCRTNRTDGRILKPLAAKRWPARALTELVKGDGDRPLVILDGDAYLLRSYEEHQFTNADAEALRQKRIEAGRAGGRASGEARRNQGAASASKQKGSKAEASASANASRASKQNEAESESEVNYLTDTTYVPESGPDSNARVLEADQAMQQLDAKKLEVATAAEQLGIRELGSTRQYLERATGKLMTLAATVELASVVCAHARHPVDNPDAYVASVCRKSPQRVREWWTQLDLQEDS